MFPNEILAAHAGPVPVARRIGRHLGRPFRRRRRWSSTVADIKLSQPDTPPRTRLLPGGRIEGEGLTMHQIMQLAWDITTDELVATAARDLSTADESSREKAL